MTLRLIRFSSLIDTSVQVANLVSLPTSMVSRGQEWSAGSKQVHAYGEDDRRVTRHSSRSVQRAVYSRIVASMDYQSDLSSAIFQWLLPILLITCVSSIST